MSDAAGLIVLVGRIAFVILFGPVAGFAFHIARSKMAEGFAQSIRFPIPAIAGWPTGVWLLLGSISIAFGIWPDVGALMIAAFLIPAAAYFHRFWELEDENQKTM